MTTQLTFIQPGNLGAQFVLDSMTRKFKINPVSSQAGNVLEQGADGNAFLTAADIQASQVTYNFGYDSIAQKLTLYEVVNGVSTIQSAVSPTVFEGSLTGVSATAGVFTITSDTGATLATLDTTVFLQSIAKANSNSIALTGAGTAASPLSAAISLDPETGNLLTVTVAGAKVDPMSVLALLNSNITHSLAVNTSSGLLTSTVNGVVATTPLVEALDISGAHIGWLVA